MPFSVFFYLKRREESHITLHDCNSLSLYFAHIKLSMNLCRPRPSSLVPFQHACLLGMLACAIRGVRVEWRNVSMDKRGNQQQKKNSRNNLNISRSRKLLFTHKIQFRMNCFTWHLLFSLSLVSSFLLPFFSGFSCCGYGVLFSMMILNEL